MTNEELWQAALGELELTLSKINFSAWFKNTAISSFENSMVVLSVPNLFVKEWLEKKYNEEIKKTVGKLSHHPVLNIIYKIEPQFLNNKVVLNKEPFPLKVNLTPAVSLPKKEKLNKYGFNPKYTFDTFIVGKSNELAYAACQAVASRPGKAYNPLFVYGDSGLGKTHLLHAIGNEMLKNSPEIKILYVSCEKFINDFIYSVRNKIMNEFKNKYRETDLLLVDDIQFISRKVETQEEFFHTFNALYQVDKQIVISSDRPPKDISDLEERLKSRFEWGMMADISSPNLETRIAILEAKCQEKKYRLDERILQFIALNIQNNVRELEGVLTKIIAYHQLCNSQPSFETIKNIVAGFSSHKTKKNVTARHLLQAVCEFYNIDEEEIISKTREKHIAFPRQILMYLMREETKYSLPSIGRELGGRDHTTVIHAVNKINKEVENNLQLRQDIETIKQKIYNSIISL